MARTVSAAVAPGGSDGNDLALGAGEGRFALHALDVQRGVRIERRRVEAVDRHHVVHRAILSADGLLGVSSLEHPEQGEAERLPGARAHAVADAVVRGAQGGVSSRLRRSVSQHRDVRLAVLLLPPLLLWPIIPTACGRSPCRGGSTKAEREGNAERRAGREQQPLPQQALRLPGHPLAAARFRTPYPPCRRKFCAMMSSFFPPKKCLHPLYFEWPITTSR